MIAARAPFTDGIILAGLVSFDGGAVEILFVSGKRDGLEVGCLRIVVKPHLHLVCAVRPESKLRLARGIETLVLQACLLGGTGQ